MYRKLFSLNKQILLRLLTGSSFMGSVPILWDQVWPIFLQAKWWSNKQHFKFQGVPHPMLLIVQVNHHGIPYCNESISLLSGFIEFVRPTKELIVGCKTQHRPTEEIQRYCGCGHLRVWRPHTHCWTFKTQDPTQNSETIKRDWGKFIVHRGWPTVGQRNEWLIEQVVGTYSQ